jgi:hypothetical protein
LRVMPAAAASACVSLLIDVRGPVGRRALCSRLVPESRFRRWRMRVLYDRVAAIDVHKDMAAPRGALLYSRLSREEFGGYSWV